MNRDDLAKELEALAAKATPAFLGEKATTAALAGLLKVGAEHQRPRGRDWDTANYDADAQLIRLLIDNLPTILAALRTPDGEDGVIMRAGRCGRHFAEDCESCQAARDVTNYELDRLRAALSASRPVGESGENGE